VVVYQEEGPDDPSIGVYNSFSKALDALRSLGTNRLGVIAIDGRLAQPVIPAGSYDLTGIALSTNILATALNVADGAQLTNLNTIGGGLTLNSLARSEAVVTLSKGFSAVELQDGATLQSDPTATQPFIHLTGSAQCALGVFFGGELIGTAAAPIVSCDAGTTLTVPVDGFVTISDHVFAGAGSITVVVSSANTVPDISTTQPAATALSYSPPIPPQAFVEVDVTLSGGTATVASGHNLTNATLVDVRLSTPNGATGQPVATFVAGPNGNVTVTSYGPTATQVTGDNSTYACIFVGAV
jgi:hypothetical protein